ncbi:bZIP transcription factor [Aspergillus lucknowensis]|uniref:BZIP domain-containing protein n=1 Tax=Aspergillus lucknowensis TaxID=176173 RepID=A0ABR4M153_9EURO
METECYSTLDWSLTTESGNPVFPAPGQAGDLWTNSELDLLLSASSYPMPVSSQLEGLEDIQQGDPPQLYGGYYMQPEEQIGDHVSSHPPYTAVALSSPNQTKQRPTKRNDDSVRKRGRPRKVPEEGGVNPEERRRMQVRMAQRAYRSRKEANVSSLKNRINQLETAMKQMSTAVISFGDELVRSGALDSYPGLLKPLGNTVQACLALPNLPHDNGDYQLELPEGPSGGRKKKQMLSLYPSPSTSGSEGGDIMDLAEFMDRLHVSCSYQAYLVCANPAFPIRRLERPFRMLFSFMPRSLVAEYFKDWLLARAGHKTLADWDHIPFFQIGGAGTHYPSNGANFFPFPFPQRPSMVVSDLSQFPYDVRQELDDVWFDLGDLEGYLREKAVVFPASIPGLATLGLGEKATNTSSVSRLIQTLVMGAVCLGRSPGFRRCDVERAVEEFQTSTAGSSG